MKFAIIISTKNVASLNIMHALRREFSFQKDVLIQGNDQFKIYKFDERITYLEGIDENIDAHILIFPSTHTSKAKVDCFAVHSIGNFGNADLGGRPGFLVPSPAGLIKECFRLLSKNNLGLSVIQEATHHGPALEKPAMFIEIGSTEEMYNNNEACTIIAKTIIEACASNQQYQTAVGIGGPHHSPNFEKITLNSETAVGHICPKYALGELDRQKLKQAMEKTIPRANFAIVDWKGLGEHKDKIKKLLDDETVAYKKTSEY